MKYRISDPTANTAIANVDRERRRERSADWPAELRHTRKPVRDKQPIPSGEPTVWRMVRFDENGRMVAEAKYIQTDLHPENAPGVFLLPESA